MRSKCERDVCYREMGICDVSGCGGVAAGLWFKVVLMVVLRVREGPDRTGPRSSVSWQTVPYIDNVLLRLFYNRSYNKVPLSIK